MSVSIDGLEDAIEEELENWKDELEAAMEIGFKETAEAAAGLLQRGGPYKERTGQYTSSWDVCQRSFRDSSIKGLIGYSVYNRDHYQLTHLLEKGHQIKKGGRAVGKAKAFVHIAPVSDTIYDLAIKKISREMEG